MGVMQEVIAVNSFDKSMRLKGKVEEDRYFAKLDQERVAALHACQRRSPAAGKAGTNRDDAAVSRVSITGRQAKS
jgi:hypothetical protein